MVQNLKQTYNKIVKDVQDANKKKQKLKKRSHRRFQQ
jgi:hypothetical protein